jgi:hypothetical protein
MGLGYRLGKETKIDLKINLERVSYFKNVYSLSI